MRRVAALSVLAVLLSAVCAFGAVKDFVSFKVNVPKGWSASAKGSTVILTKANKSAKIKIVVDSKGGKSLDQLAEIFAKQCGSSDLEEIEGYYVFTFKNGRGLGRVFDVSRGRYHLEIMEGSNLDEMDETAEICDTIVVK